jgi:hypothetical protein
MDKDEMKELAYKHAQKRLQTLLQVLPDGAEYERLCRQISELVIENNYPIYMKQDIEGLMARINSKIDERLNTLANADKSRTVNIDAFLNLPEILDG